MAFASTSLASDLLNPVFLSRVYEAPRDRVACLTAVAQLVSMLPMAGPRLAELGPGLQTVMAGSLCAMLGQLCSFYTGCGPILPVSAAAMHLPQHPQPRRLAQQLLAVFGGLPGMLRVAQALQPADDEVQCADTISSSLVQPAKLLNLLCGQPDAHLPAEHAAAWCDAASAGLRALPLLDEVDERLRGCGNIQQLAETQLLRRELLVLYKQASQLSMRASPAGPSDALTRAVQLLHTTGCRLAHSATQPGSSIAALEEAAPAWQMVALAFSLSAAYILDTLSCGQGAPGTLPPGPSR